MAVAGGAHGYVQIAGALIEATFGGASDPPHPPMPQHARKAVSLGRGDRLRARRAAAFSRAFWRMTPREFALAIEGVCGRGAEPLARATFDELMTRYPDGR